MALTTNFNVSPYFDDYDEDKKFYKILFRPTTAVQARELNQMQTILQKQIERFGQHIFREGSIVVGGEFDLELKIGYVKAANLNPLVEANTFVGKTMVGASSGLKAYVRAVEYDEPNLCHAFMIRYLNATNTATVFLEGETIQWESNTSYNFTALSSNATGNGSVFSIGQGVVFSKGYFIAFPSQSIVIDKYSSTPTASIGFNYTESIITDLQDSSLLDNAQGSTNENAPGAHRFFIDSELIKISLGTGGNNANYSNLLDIANGVIVATQERTLYSRIGEEWARRTFDESGDYYVRGFGVRTREHLNTGINEGLFTANQSGNSSLLSIDIEPGTAYVKGYEVPHLVTEHVITEKSTASNSINGSVVNARTGGYFLIKEMVGFPVLDEGTVINLYDAAETRITNNTSSATAPTGNVIGTARVKSVMYDSGTIGTAAARYRIYLYDVQMSADVLSRTRGLGLSGEFFADVVVPAISNNAILNIVNENVLVFPVGSDHVKSIRGNTGTVDTSFVFHRTDAGKTLSYSAGGGNVSISVTTSGESLAYSTGSLSTDEKRQVFVTFNANKDFQLPGTVSATTGQSNVIGGSTSFSKLSLGDRIKINGNFYFINNIHTDTNLEVVGTLPTIGAGNSIFRSFLTGDNIDLSGLGSSGNPRTAIVSSGNLIINLNEDTSITTGGSTNVDVTYRVNRSTAAEVKKKLRSSRFVKIDCSSLTSLTNPINLGLSDVYKIRYVRMNTAAFTSESEGIDVTSNFVFDNGQRDSFYDHATIKPVGIGLTNKHLLVKLDHFETDFSGGFGYFSVDSYPIDDTTVSDTTIFTYDIPSYTSAIGTKYDLRNVLDFRPYKTPTASSSTTISGASTNPATTTSLLNPGSGLRTPVPDSLVYLDYQYYLARRDIVTLDRYGNFNLIKGQPAIFPVSPDIPENVMGVASVYVPPYPSISETLARIIGNTNASCKSNNIANIRYTMRDIGVLKSRIENLEYYNALTLLEKSAIDLKVTDEDGLDRFKNGFFVDGFLDHSLGATYNPDYNIAVDKIEQAIRPRFEFDGFQFRFHSSLSSGVTQTGNLITLPYSNTVLTEQTNVTTIRNIEQSVFRFLGNIIANPEGDTWCNTKQVDKTIEFGNDIAEDTIMETEWGSWQTYFTGYNLYDRTIKDRSGIANPNQFIGSYTSYADVVAASKKDSDGRTLIETVQKEKREGLQTSISFDKETKEIGNFVTDVGVQPYIRPQVIQLYVQGLKSGTRMYVFFDGEDMSDYTTPAVDQGNGFLKVYDGTDILTFGAEGSTLRVDEYGDLLVFLRLPAEGRQFRTGTKEIVVTDSPTNAIDATTYAKKAWTAIGINATKQNTIISTVVPVIEKKVIPDDREKRVTEVIGPSCMAYSFKVEVPEEEEGVFLTSIDVYIESMHPTLGAWFEIREIDSAGGITRNQVPYSEVWMRRNDSRIKTNPFSSGRTFTGTSVVDPDTSNPYRTNTYIGGALVPTNINFPSPVFLLNNTQYAFVIHTEGLNPDTYFYVSRLGETDLVTGNEVTDRRLKGTLYVTNNNLNYDMVQDVDLLVKFNRAVFTTGSTGTAVFGNKPTEFVNLQYGGAAFAKIGEDIAGSETVALSLTASANSVIIGDQIYGQTSGVTGNVVASLGSNTFQTSGIGFTNTENIIIYASNNANKNISGNVVSVVGGSGYLQKYDDATNFMMISNSNGKFFNGGKIRGKFSGNTGFILNSERLTLDLDNRYKAALVANTNGVNPSTNTILISSANSIFLSGDKVYYEVDTGNTAIYGLTGNTEYFINFANSSAITLSETVTGANVYISENRTANSETGHRLISSIRNFSNSIGLTDIILNISNNLVNGSVTAFAGKSYFTNGAGFSVGDTVYVTSSGGTNLSITGVVTEVQTGFDNYPYSTTNLKPAYLVFNKTTCTFEKRGFLASTNNYGSYELGFPNSSSDFDQEHVILTRKSEIATANVSGNGSAQFRASLRTESQYVSPVVDVARCSSVFVHNIINNYDLYEDNVSGGYLKNKYISKIVTLAEKQDAEDLIVRLSAYRPPGTDIKVWFKILHNEDSVTIDQRPWIEMDYNEDLFSSKADRNDYKESTYSVPDKYKDSNGIICYESNGITFRTFIQYQIKIGLYATDSAFVPRVADLVTTALQL